MEENAIENIQTVSKFRRIFPQFLATVIRSLVLTNQGQYYGFLAVLIPALTGLTKELNPDETLEVTSNQASWLAAITAITAPFGCLLGGPLSEALGRRKVLILTNLIFFLFWAAIGFSQSYLTICTLFVLFGLTLGLCEPSMVTYGAEICESSVRGILQALSLIFLMFGPLISMAIGTVFSWREVSFICAIFPIFSGFGLLLAPESPVWLVSKDRFKEAQKSLQWLRGWVSPQTVHREFVELRNYSNTSNACEICTKQSIRCYHPKPTLWDKTKELKQRRIIRPFCLIVGFEIFSNFSLSLIWEPYIVQVFNAFGTPIKPTYASVLSTSIGILGCVCLLSTIKKIGRRKLYLTSISIIAMCCFGLSIYGFILLPPGWTSFKVDSNEQSNDPIV